MTNYSATTYNTFCNIDNLKSIRDFIKKNLSIRNITDPDQHLIMLAVDEICTNSIIHGNKNDSNSSIDVLLQYNSGKLVIEIADQGDAFDYTEYHEPDIQQLIKTKQKGSMGLMLVKRIMDQIEFQRVNNKNICRLIKQIRNKKEALV